MSEQRTQKIKTFVLDRASLYSPDWPEFTLQPRLVSNSGHSPSSAFQVLWWVTMLMYELACSFLRSVSSPRSCVLRRLHWPPYPSTGMTPLWNPSSPKWLVSFAVISAVLLQKPSRFLGNGDCVVFLQLPPSSWHRALGKIRSLHILLENAQGSVWKATGMTPLRIIFHNP